MMMISRNAFLAAAIAAAMPLSAAFADDGDRADRRAAERQAITGASIDAGAAITAARNAGYGPVRELEWDHGVWEVKTYDNQGRRVRLNVDPASGAVTRRTH